MLAQIQFVKACADGNESRAKSLYQADPSIVKLDGWTGLTYALYGEHHSLSRWLLSLPTLDTNICDRSNETALHWACGNDAPLDIMITLAKLSTWDTVNMQDNWGDTVLDDTATIAATSAALYLSWLGAECKEENRQYGKVTLQTWIEEGCQQDAQYWAVAANDVESLKLLARMENVTLDRERLRYLAKLFNHRAVWSYVTSLQSLAWEKMQKSFPALVNLPPSDLLDKHIPNHVVGIINSYKKEFFSVPKPETYIAWWV